MAKKILNCGGASMMEVPAINEKTGVSTDYWNEYFGIKLIFNSLGVKGVADIIKKTPVLKYKEKYPTDKYKNVINEKNRDRVAKLDDIADSANTTFSDISNFTETDFKKAINKVYFIIYGEGPNFIYRYV